MNNMYCKYKGIIIDSYSKYETLFQSNESLKSNLREINSLCSMLENSPFLPNYSVSDMIHCTNMLDLLNFVELLKYRNHTLKAQSILRRYLYSGYDLKSITKINPFSEYSIFQVDPLHYNYFKPIDPIPFSKKPISYMAHNPMDDYHTLPKSIRSEFETFLKEQFQIYDDALFPHNRYYFNLFRIEQRNDAKNAHRKYHPTYLISAYEIFEFALIYAYTSGRDFSNWNKSTEYVKHRVPKYNSTWCCSESSYRYVASEIQKFFPIFPSSNAFFIAKRHSLNNIFYIYKLNLFSRYKSVYNSEYFINSLLNTYSFEYSEIIALKAFLNKKIFEDNNFISTLLNNPYVDSFLIFHIYFLTSVVHSLPNIVIYTGRNTALLSLERNITTAKQQTINFVSKYEYLYFENYKKEFVDIDLIENKILNILVQNKAFLDIYHTTYIDNLDFSRISCKLPIDFSCIKRSI